MVRALITFDEQQLKKLDRIARKDKKSRASLVREAIEQYVAKKEKEPTWEEIVKKTAGLWAHKKIDTDIYLERIRSEWDR